MGRYARGTGARGVGHRCTQHSPRAWRPVWPWEPAQSPAHLFSLRCLMILCWSCLPAVCQRGPKMSRTPTPRKAGKDTHCQCSDVFTFQLTSTVSRFNLDGNSRTKLSITFVLGFTRGRKEREKRMRKRRHGGRGLHFHGGRGKIQVL